MFIRVQRPCQGKAGSVHDIIAAKNALPALGCSRSIIELSIHTAVVKASLERTIPCEVNINESMALASDSCQPLICDTLASAEIEMRQLVAESSHFVKRRVRDMHVPVQGQLP